MAFQRHFDLMRGDLCVYSYAIHFFGLIVFYKMGNSTGSSHL